MGQCYCAVVTTVSFAGVRPVHVMNVERHQGLPTLRSSQPTGVVNRDVRIVLSSKADTHFTVPRRVEGWLNRGLYSKAVQPYGLSQWFRINVLELQPTMGYDPPIPRTAVRHV